MTIAVPPAIPLAHLLVLWLRPAWNGWKQLLAIAGGIYLWSALALLLLVTF